MKSKQTIYSKFSVAAAFAFFLAGLPGPGWAQLRLEMRPIETITLTADQFLVGDKNGKAATLVGELRIPKPGTEKLPAVILIHGSGGLGAHLERWAQEINSVGVATFLVDSFSGRGIVNTVTDQSQLATLAMMVDAYRALEALASHPPHRS